MDEMTKLLARVLRRDSLSGKSEEDAYYFGHVPQNIVSRQLGVE